MQSGTDLSIVSDQRRVRIRERFPRKSRGAILQAALFCKRNRVPPENPLAALRNEIPMIPRLTGFLLLVCFVSQPLAAQEMPRPRIQAEGVSGTLVFCGSPTD